MKSITVKNIQLHVVSLPYVEPLTTSFGAEPDKSAVVIELETTAGVIGWGEGVTEINPGYGYETIGTGLHVSREFLIPRLIGQTIEKATDVPALLASVRGNNFAKAGLEAAVWDALAKTNDLRLADYFASFLPEGHESRNRATVGVS
ncbi:MAG: hypothetical protein K8I60_12305, partial [Anaerolineae bacterium]|nr:hypothetical protein [Anaerolineae bacterium]